MSALENYKPKFYVPPENARDSLREHMLVDGFDFVLDCEGSRDGFFVEARTEKKYLDFFTCFASMPLGMNHPKTLDKDFVEYMGKISLNKPSNSDIYTSVMTTFVKTLFNIAAPKYFKHSFYISGGALAVENALKTAFDWKVRKNFRKGYNREVGDKILHFENAFHGRTGYTMSLTNTDPKKIKYFPKFDWPRVSTPSIDFPLNDKSLEDVANREKKSIEEIKKAFADNKDEIAAIIIEPIQGEGGDKHFRSEFLQNLKTLADENEAMLIFDEVQTGVGVTGKWWAHEHFDVEPDIMCFGKKMQVCGILVGEKVDEEPQNVFTVSSRINSTWGANLIDMARATKFLEIIDEEKCVENAALNGKYLLEKIEALSEEYPGVVEHPRGRGLFCAFDLSLESIRDEVVSKCFDEGLIILPCGTNSIRFRPPLNVSKEHIDQGMEIIAKSVADTV